MYGCRANIADMRHSICMMVIKHHTKATLHDCALRKNNFVLTYFKLQVCRKSRTLGAGNNQKLCAYHH